MKYWETVKSFAIKAKDAVVFSAKWVKDKAVALWSKMVAAYEYIKK